MTTGSTTPSIGGQPAWRRLRIGGLDALVVSDGVIEADDVASEFPSVPESGASRLRDAPILARGPAELQLNCLLLHVGGRLVLFDAGMGASPLLGGKSGRLPESLAAAGIDRNAITAVILTHLHCDHAWGLVDPRGRPAFPNAGLFLSRIDFDFWNGGECVNRRNQLSADEIEATRAALAPYADRTSFVGERAEVIAGVTAVPTPGHTRGHMSYIIGSAGERFIVIGDLCHHEAVQFANPHWHFRWDDDPAQAVRSRSEMLRRAADEGLGLIGFHLPFPGVGRVLRAGAGFQFIAATADAPTPQARAAARRS